MNRQQKQCPTRSSWATGFKGKKVFFGQAWNKSLIQMASGGGNALYCPSVCIWVSGVQVGEGAILGALLHVVFAARHPDSYHHPHPWLLPVTLHSSRRHRAPSPFTAQCLQDPTAWERVQRGSLPAAQNMAQTLGEEEMLPVVWLLFPFRRSTFYVFILKMYFIYLAVPDVGCRTQDLQSLLRHAGIFSCGMRTPVAAHGICFPNQGSNLCPCIGSPSHWPSSKVPILFK